MGGPGMGGPGMGGPGMGGPPPGMGMGAPGMGTGRTRVLQAWLRRAWESGPPGMEPGMMGPGMGGTGASNEGDNPYEVVIELCGIIYIYNPPNPEKLATGTGSERTGENTTDAATGPAAVQPGQPGPTATQPTRPASNRLRLPQLQLHRWVRLPTGVPATGVPPAAGPMPGSPPAA